MTCLSLKNGFLCLAKTDFNCPVCGKHYTESDYYRQLDKSRDGLIYKKCKGMERVRGDDYGVLGES